MTSHHFQQGHQMKPITPRSNDLKHSVFLHKQLASIRVLFFSLTVIVSFNRLLRVFAVWFQISVFFSTSVRFSTKTLPYLAYKAYKAYKAFMAFKRSRLNPFEKYCSITSFSVDWQRTIRLLYGSVDILSVYTIKLQVIVNQNHWTSIAKTTTPEQIQNGWQKSFISKNLMVRQVTRPCPCMTTSIIINITHVISMWAPSPLLDHSWLSWCWGPNDYWELLRNFSISWRRKNKGVLWLRYHRYPSE